MEALTNGAEDCSMLVYTFKENAPVVPSLQVLGYFLSKTELSENVQFAISMNLS